MRRRSGTVVVALVAVAVVAASCGKTKPPRDAAGGPVVLSVSAASSLTEAFTTIRDRFEKAHPDVKVILNFGASSELVQQLRAGSPTDVLATADGETMTQAADGGLVGKPVTFARNRLALLVGPGNPKQIKFVRDLARDGVTFVVCAPEVPCGRFGQQVLDRARIRAKPKSLEPNVKAAVTRVTTGEVDAALVYRTDVRAAGSRAEGIDIPPSLNATASYPIATAKATKRSEVARQFVDFVTSPAGEKVLTGDGFLLPS